MKNQCSVIALTAWAAFGMPFASPAAEPENAGARIDALFAEWDTGATPGCSVAVSKDGAIVHERGYGMANLDHAIRNHPDTVFHVASVSKQFTAAAIGMLILEGRISPDDSVRKHLPELPEVNQPVTIDHLIRHTSGLRDFSDLMDLSGWRYYQDLVTQEDAIGVQALQRTLAGTPGAEYRYNNSNYLLLGEIVARVTGQSLREFTARRIFTPLGMQHSHFRDEFAEITPNFASGYEASGDTFLTSLTQFSAVGYSSLLTTALDLMKWEENFHTAEVGGQALIDLMLTPTKLPDGKLNDYAYGVVVTEHRGLPVVRHSGGDAGYSSHLVRFPQQRLSVAVLCNLASIDAHRLATRAAEIYLGLPAEDAATPAYVELPEGELKPKAGRYLDAGTERTLVLEFADGKLRSVTGDDVEEVKASADGRFFLGDGEWQLAFDETASTVTMSRYGGTPVRLGRVTGSIPQGDALDAYAGRYLSEEIEAPFRVERIGSKLVLRSIKFRETLTPVTPEVFLAGWTHVVFTLDAGGRATGFRYGDSGATLARFTRQAP